MPTSAGDIISSFIKDTVEYQRVLRRRMEEVEDKEFETITQRMRSALLPSKAVTRLEKRLNETEKERATAVSKISNLELELEGKQKQILTSGEKVAQAKVTVETHAKTITDLQLQLSDAAAQLKVSENNIASLKKKELSYKQQESDLQATIHNKDNDLQQAAENEALLKTTVKSLRESLRNANHLIKKLEEDVANATQTATLLAESKDELEKQLENAAREWSTIHKEHEAKEPEQTPAATASESVDMGNELLETISSQRILMQNAQDEVDDLMTELNNVRNQNEKLTHENSHLTNELSTLEERYQALNTQFEDKSDQLILAAADADFAAGSAKRAEQNVAAMDAKIALLQGKVDALQEASISKDEQLAAKEAVLSTITYSNDQNEVTIKQLEAQLSDTQPKYDTARLELEHVRDELVQKSSEIHSQNRTIADLKRQLRLVGGELETRAKTEGIYRAKAEEYRSDAEGVRVQMMGTQAAFEQDLIEVRDALRITKSDLHKQRLANNTLTVKLRDSEAAIDELSKEATDTVAVLKNALTDAQHEITENRAMNKRFAADFNRNEDALRSNTGQLESSVSTTASSSARPTPSATPIKSCTWEPVPVTDLIISVPRTTHSVRPTPAPFSPVV